MERVLQCVRLPQGKKGTIGFNLKGEYLKMFGFKQGDKAKVEINANNNCPIIIKYLRKTGNRSSRHRLPQQYKGLLQVRLPCE